jgi:hypothetical protein
MTRIVLGLVLGALALSGCAWSNNTVVMPLEYRLAGADPQVRKGFEQGLERLEAGDHPAALGALNRALWDLERLDRRSLRIEEMADLYLALARTYRGLRREPWAEEHRQLAARVRQAGDRPAEVRWVQTKERARAAYLGARFRDALSGLHDLLVELEDVLDPAQRVAHVEMARCYLAFTHWALGDEARVREELERLAALDGSLTACRREAPPAVRALISQVQKKRATRE